MNDQDINPMTQKDIKPLEPSDSFSVSKNEPPTVAVQGINFFYGEGENRIQVLFDNNLNIYPGEIVIMTGPSGSGKTTLLTLIGALRSVQEGSLKVFGRELRGLSHKKQVEVRRGIGFIFQAHNLFEALTAQQNVRMAMELGDYKPEDFKQLPRMILAELQLEEHMNKTPHGLSGGQRQRVAIGRALVNRPRLILADEPTAALDKDTGRLVVDYLKKLAKEDGSSVIIVTHDNRILDTADRIVRMVDGHVESDVDVAESLAIVSFLKKCHLFKDSTPVLLANTAGRMLKEKYVAGTDVIIQGDIGDKFYIIKSGRMVVILESDGQSEVVLKLGPGDFFGELALLREEPRAATVRAVENVELLTLSKGLFTELLKISPSFEDQLKNAYFY
jgi:putative ABC transport system ATP-binding protein